MSTAAMRYMPQKTTMKEKKYVICSIPQMYHLSEGQKVAG